MHKDLTKKGKQDVKLHLLSKPCPHGNYHPPTIYTNWNL